MFGVRSKLSGLFGNGEAGASAYQRWDMERPRFNGDIEAEELATLLSNRRRNITIAVLNGDGPITLHDLANTVALNENVREAGVDVMTGEADIDDYQPENDHVANVRDTLRRNHLPRLEEHDILERSEYETNEEGEPFIRPGDNGEAAWKALNELAGYCTQRE